MRVIVLRNFERGELEESKLSDVLVDDLLAIYIIFVPMSVCSEEIVGMLRFLC